MLKRMFLLQLFFAWSCVAFSQQHFPEIGRPCPNYTLKNIRNFRVNSLSIADFKGRSVILDLWTKGCISCIASFPKISSLQKQFGNELDIVAICLNQEDAVLSMFEKTLKRNEISVSSAFDSVAFRSIYPDAGVPHLIWIDKEGIVQAITTGISLNEVNVDKFLRGAKFPFVDVSFAALTRKYPCSIALPFFVEGNCGSENSFTFRSMITEWNPNIEMKWMPFTISSSIREYNGLLQGMASLKSLYLFAYTGSRIFPEYVTDPLYKKFFPEPILELADPSRFDDNLGLGYGYYLYSLKVPDSIANPERMLKILKNDLNNYFNYKVKIETREMPYWSVTVTPEGKKRLATKGGAKKMHDYSYVDYVNVPWATELFPLLFSNYSISLKFPIIDESGINSNVDYFERDRFVSAADFVANLKKKGILLTKSKRKFQVIVISDN